MMRVSIICQLCVERSRETNKQTLDQFHRVLRSQQYFLRCRFTTFVKYSSHAWSLVYYLSEVFKPCLESGLLP